MKDLVDILADSLDAEPTKKAEVLHLVETLYFENVRGSFIWRTVGRQFYPISKSEAFKIAQDIINIEKSIRLNSTITDVKLTSITIKNKFNSEAILKSIKSLEKIEKTIDDNTLDKLHKHLLKDYKHMLLQ